MAVIIKRIRLKGSKGEIEKDAIFDSGSTYSCINPGIAENLGVVEPLPETMEFSTAEEGRKVVAKGAVRLNFYIEDYRFSDEFMVIEGLTNGLMIGAASLQKWRLKLDFEKDEVIIDPRVTKLWLLRMEALAGKKVYTLEDYLKTPDDKRYELIEGELIMTPSPVTLHQRISRKIAFTIDKFVTENKLGEVFYAPYDVYLQEDDRSVNVVQPDILFVSKERALIIGDKNIEGAPDLAVEILSEGTEYRDTIKKKHLYERFKVKEYWVIAPDDRIVEVYSLEGERYRLLRIFYGDETLESEVLKGLTIDLKTIW